MKKHTFYLPFLTFLLSVTLSACDDFFNTDPDILINSDDYISKEDEMYKGFLAILTKMQRAGDHPIFLTDTRADIFEITDNAPIELQNLYHYENTDGNTYADPTCFYAIVVACNDFFQKMEQYKAKIGNHSSEKSQANFKALISSAIRIKVWAYYTIGRIYGEAVWFDDPLEELRSLKDQTVFTRLENMEHVTLKCLDLLDNGLMVDGEPISSTLEMDWVSWIDEENADEEAYGYWNYLTPPYLLLRCELLSWKCSYQDNLDDWRWMRDTIVGYLNYRHTNELDDDANKDRLYQCCIPLTGTYYSTFYSEQVGNKYQLVSGIMYDYENEQLNRLVQYFCPAYPGDGFYLQPSPWGLSRYSESDIRGKEQQLSISTINGSVAFCKYYYHRGTYLRNNIFEIMPTIVLFRGHDYHFLLAEAENHLGNWLQAYTILNNGLENQFSDGRVVGVPADWSPNYNSWFGQSGGYGNVGIAGCARGTLHDLPRPTDDGYSLDEASRVKLYDLALADEYGLEYVGEGKTYSYLVKMAERYGKDASVLTDRILPKYPEARRAKVRASLEENYWIKWTLEVDEQETK